MTMPKHNGNMNTTLSNHRTYFREVTEFTVYLHGILTVPVPVQASHDIDDFCW